MQEMADAILTVWSFGVRGVPMRALKRREDLQIRSGQNELGALCGRFRFRVVSGSRFRRKERRV